jgi:hypothetical protein
MTTRLSNIISWSGRVLATVVAITAGLFVLADLIISQWPDDLFGLKQMISGIGLLFVSWASIIVAFALLLGFVNVVKTHWNQIKNKTPNTVNSAVLLAALVITLLAGFGGPDTANSRFIFNFILQPLESTIFALLALFIVTAAFRAFRVRSLESFFFVFFAVIVLLGQVPVGIYLWEELPIIKDWIINVPTMAGMRGILLGVALGTIATGLRVLMGVDRPYTE